MATVHKQVMGKIARTYKPIVSQLTIGTSVRMEGHNIEDWKKAIDAARREINPDRRQLFKLFENIAIDGHTTSVMEKRRNNVTNKNLRFIAANGNPDDFVNDHIIKTTWFYDMLGHAMDAVAYGHSLIELKPEKGIIAEAELINRRNVIPEKQFLKWNEANYEDGIFYKEDPYYKNHFIDVGGKKNYGKLMVAAQYIIYKQGCIGDWAQLVELFSNPFRVGKYNLYDEEARQHLNTAMSGAGSAQYLIIPEGTSVDFPNPIKPGQSDTMKDLVELCNEEISKIFLGQTMTTSNGSSLSQSQVHKEVEEEITLSDMISMEHLLNWQVCEKLKALGVPLPEGRFEYPETANLNLNDRISIDAALNGIIEIPANYWYDTYGIDEPEGGAQLKLVQNNPLAKEDKPAGEAKPEEKLEDEGGEEGQKK